MMIFEPGVVNQAVYLPLSTEWLQIEEDDEISIVAF